MRVSMVTVSIMAALAPVGTGCSSQQDDGVSECEVMLDTLQRQLLLINANLNELARRVAAKDKEKSTLLGPRTSSWRYNTGAERRPEKKQSWDSQLRYMKVVEDKETELQRLRECCNKLMATHVSHQMKKIKEIEQKLQTCMQARLAREKEERAKKRRSMVRSDLTALPSPPVHLFKGAYYKQARTHYKQQSKYGRQQQQRLQIVEHDESAESSTQLVESASSTYDQQDTQLLPAVEDEPRLQLPPVRPLVEMLGTHDNTEKLSQLRYSSELRQIASTQRLLRHMFNTVHTHQNMASSFCSQLPPLPQAPTTRRSHAVSSPSQLPPAAVQSTTNQLLRHSPVAAVPAHTRDMLPAAAAAVPAHIMPTAQHTMELLPPATTPPLSVENLLVSAALPVKEPKRPSMLWTNYLH